MTTSIDIAMYKEPSFEELKTCINDVFLLFNLPQPTYHIENNHFLFIQLSLDQIYWFSIHYFEPMIREVPECDYMGSVHSRSKDWWSAGVIVYAICKNFGKIIFNDSGATLGEPGTYTISEFKKMLDDRNPNKF